MKSLHAGCSLLLGLFIWVGAAGAQTLNPVDAGGGAVSQPVARGDYLYVGTGATISVWNMADPSQPVQVGRTSQAPTLGMINGLAAVGDYLYAAWTTTLGTGGLTVYSLADPALPVAIAENDDVVAAGLAAVGNYVYIGDAYNGTIVAVDVSDPLHPQTGAAVSGFGAASGVAMAAFGNQLLATGSGFLGDRQVYVFDLSDPANPALAGSTSLDGFTVLRAALTDGYAIGVGFELQVYDLSDPANISQVFATAIDTATGAIRRGDVLYLVGASGIQVWDFGTPSAPSLLRTVPIDAFAPDQTADTPFGPLILTHTDHALLLGASDPQNPTLAADFALPIGVSVHDGAFDADHVYFAEEGYGIGVADPATLAPLGRYDADLPPDLSARDIEGIAVDSGRAYIAVWGYGVFIADLSDPVHPVELGHFEFPFATAIEAHGDRVYVGSSTNGGIFKILDVTDPTAPQELGSLTTSKTLALTVRGDYAYLADDADFGDGGLRVVDVSDPATPLLVGQYTDCGYNEGLDVSADGNTAYLACTGDGSLRIVDTTDKANPTEIGRVTLPDNPLLPGYNVAYDVVVDGTTAYVGNIYGVDEIDISNPAAPQPSARHETGFDVRKLAQAPNGRIFAFAGLAGTYVYAPTTPDRIFSDGFEQSAP